MGKSTLAKRRYRKILKQKKRAKVKGNELIHFILYRSVLNSIVVELAVALKESRNSNNLEEEEVHNTTPREDASNVSASSSCDEQATSFSYQDEPAENTAILRIAKLRTVPVTQYRKLEEELETVKGLVDYYQVQRNIERMKADDLNKDCQARIAKVSQFWKKKIYEEGTRAGILLKRAMQKSGH